MKFRVYMKDPDGVSEAIRDAAEEWGAKLPDVTEAERESMVDDRVETLRDSIGFAFEYGECLMVEVDTTARTCVVVPP
jgi:hypothetical protein